MVRIPFVWTKIWALILTCRFDERLGRLTADPSIFLPFNSAFCPSVFLPAVELTLALRLLFI